MSFEFLIPLFGILGLVYPVYHYFVGIKKSEDGLKTLIEDGLSADIICHFKLDGSQIVFDFNKRQIGFANSEFHWKGETFRGPRDILRRSTKIKNVNEISEVSCFRRVEEGSNFKVGTIYFKFIHHDGCVLYQVAIGYSSRYDGDAAEILEENWLKMKTS
jgi:hypothetical protein